MTITLTQQEAEYLLSIVANWEIADEFLSASEVNAEMKMIEKLEAKLAKKVNA